MPDEDQLTRFAESCSIPFQAWLVSDDQTMPDDPLTAVAEHHARSRFSPKVAEAIIADPEVMETLTRNLIRREARHAAGQATTPPPRPRPRPAQSTYRKTVIPPALRWEVFERDDFTCRICGSRRLLQADHIVAERRGGPTTLDNLQTLCGPCNARKGWA